MQKLSMKRPNLLVSNPQFSIPKLHAPWQSGARGFLYMLLMEEILHHFGPMIDSNFRDVGTSCGAGFPPATVPPSNTRIPLALFVARCKKEERTAISHESQKACGIQLGYIV